MKKTLRLHDKFYLKENRYENIKESFKELIKLLKLNLKFKKKFFSILDVGCANGELTYNLNKAFPDAKITGLDIRQDLLNKAKKNTSKKIRYVRRDISKRELNLHEKFDIIICAGVLAIFDDHKIILKNLKKHLKTNGEIYIFGNFNENDYDVFIKYKDLNKHKNILQSGWNIWSLKTVKKFFINKKIQVNKFHIKKKITKQKKDPIRSWTIKIANKNYFLNGISVLQNQFWIRIY